MNLHGSQSAKQRKKVLLAVALIAACTIGILGGRFLVFYQYPILQDSGFANLSYSYNKIMNDYLEGADSKALLNGATEGMVASLKDPYSVYLPGEKGEQYMKSYEDHIVGVGIELREQDGEFVIEETTKDAPAEKAGIKRGDVLLTVNGKKVAGMTFDQLLALVRGKEDTEVKLELRRDGANEPLLFTVKRGSVPIRTVTSAMKPGEMGFIAISRFADKTGEEFDQAVDALLAKGMKSLLLDLRGNPGGLLEPTIHIASRFVPKGETVVQVVNKDEKRIVTHESEQQKPWKIPIAILVDGRTASSSEVLTAALKSKANAEVIGERTFGKGIVQQFRQLRDGSVLKLTEAQWRSPDGQWIHKKGIEPTLEVKAPAYTLLPRLPAGTKLQEGDYGNQVENIQKLMQAIGYDTGPSLGIYSAEMTSAVKQFQQHESLPVTGIVNDRTAYQVSKRLLEKYRAEDPQMLKAIEFLKTAT